MGFRWLEVLEKDFDKAFVDLDILLGDIDEDQHDLVLEGRERLTRCAKRIGTGVAEIVIQIISATMNRG